MGEASCLLVDSSAEFRAAVEGAGERFDLTITGAKSATAGLQLAGALEPDCIVTSLALPDHDGLWLLARLRASPPPLDALPVVLLAPPCDMARRLGLLQSGVDVLLDQPIAPHLLLAQVRALTTMTRRIRDRDAVSSMLRRAAADDAPPTPGPGAPLLGDLVAMPPATALTILELDRRSGVLEMLGVGQPPLLLELASGVVLAGREGGKTLGPDTAVRAALSRKVGRFEFRAGPNRPAPEGATPTTRHLWLAIDEAARSLEGTPTVADFAPEFELETLKPPKIAPPVPARSPPPQRKTTLVSSQAVNPAGQPPRRQSALVRAAISIDDGAKNPPAKKDGREERPEPPKKPR